MSETNLDYHCKYLAVGDSCHKGIECEACIKKWHERIRTKVAAGASIPQN